MNAPNPTLMVQEFAKRTRINLEFIEVNSKQFGTEVFETTQLLNSMLGLLVFPVERILNQLLSERRLDGLSELNIKLKTVFDKRQEKNKYHNQVDLLKMIRNAFSHGNVNLGNSGEINYIELWNYPPRVEREPQNENWRIKVHHSQLRKLVLALCRILEKDLPTLDLAGEGTSALRGNTDLLPEEAA